MVNVPCVTVVAFVLLVCGWVFSARGLEWLRWSDGQTDALIRKDPIAISPSFCLWRTERPVMNAQVVLDLPIGLDFIAYCNLFTVRHVFLLFHLRFLLHLLHLLLMSGLETTGIATTLIRCYLKLQSNVSID